MNSVSKLTRKAQAILSIVLVAMGLTPYWAETAGNREIHVVGLYSGRVAINIDGQMHILREGQTSPEGALLKQADSDQAVIEFEGKERVYRLSDVRVAPYRQAAGKQRVSLLRNARGLYETTGSINGQNVAMLVDTGASLVAIPAQQARDMGIDYRLDGQKIQLTTASGNTAGWQVNLDSVRLGDFLEKNVMAVVIEGETAGTVLLGMSYLERLRLNHQGDVLVVEARY